jgi:hypothetical protein
MYPEFSQLMSFLPKIIARKSQVVDHNVLNSIKKNTHTHTHTHNWRRKRRAAFYSSFFCAYNLQNGGLSWWTCQPYKGHTSLTYKLVLLLLLDLSFTSNSLMMKASATVLRMWPSKNQILTSKFSHFLFGKPSRNRVKTATRNGWETRLLIANHLEQS